MEKILLTGYMGSGKTTIARLLARASGISYIDLDEAIEKKVGKSIDEIFRQDGEVKFRKLEHEMLKELLERQDGLIIALGGGTPCYANNHEYLKRDDVVSVYLKAGINELAGRIESQGAGRPLVDSLKGEELKEYIAKHLFDRSYYYMQAKHIVNTNSKPPEAIVNEIMSLF